MFIIFISHMPANGWALWIPARFGFSDATEIFVFCSGMASAIAFAKTFDRHGFWIGTARVSYRVWQVYWGHICLFFTLAGMLAAVDTAGWSSIVYLDQLNLRHFFERTQDLLPALMTLTYVPNYFDILPMYLVILLLMPLMMLSAHWGGARMALALSVIIWFAATFGILDLPAEPWSDRTWFFNPFAWQLLFFTGFAFMRGWLPAPPVDRRLIVLALGVVLATIPFAYYRLLLAFPSLDAVSAALKPLTTKSEFGVLRYVHFLSVAYLAWVAVGPDGERLTSNSAWNHVVGIVQKVGQQSLAVFLASLVLAQGLGVVRDIAWGRGVWGWTVAINLVGFAGLIAVAYIAAWYKSQPWRKKPPIEPSHVHRGLVSAPEVNVNTSTKTGTTV